MNIENFDWSERYRPRTVADTILPEETKRIFQGHVDSGNLPNLLLKGQHGVGKTTIALAAIAELGCDVLVKNGSIERNIDTLRTDITEFASSVSFNGLRKYVVIDEADGLNPLSTQPAFRNFTETYSKNCGFIFTCNHPNKIIKELRSRFTEVNFQIKQDEFTSIAKQYLSRASAILDQEGVPYDRKVVAALITKHFPNFRSVINTLQYYAKSGQIDNGVLTTTSDEQIVELLKYVKDKKWNDMRRWVVKNSDIEPTEVMRLVYDRLDKYLTDSSKPQVVVTMSKYAYQSALCSDQEINLVAWLTELCVEAQWK